MNLKEEIKKKLPQGVIKNYRTFQTLVDYMEFDHTKKYVNLKNVKFLSDKETVDMIINQQVSVARFGDGEFEWIFGEGRQAFQQQSIELQNDLISTLNINDAKLLIGIPRGIIGIKENNMQAKLYWNMVNRKYAQKLCDNHHILTRTFCDASITRPYIDYCSWEDSEKRFANLKRIWNGRKILIVEGTGTKIGVNNDLLQNSARIRRILCPPKDAYSKIELIENSIRMNVDDDELVLVALGPTATIIAGNLYREGIQIIDIGHIDVEYIWFLRKDKYRTPIIGKSVNESGSIYFDDGYIDEKYKASIIETIE